MNILILAAGILLLIVLYVIVTESWKHSRDDEQHQGTEPSTYPQIIVNSNQYVLHIDFPEGRDEYFCWDVIEKVYANRPENLLVVRLRNGEEHTYRDARKFEAEKVSEVGDYMFWEKPTNEE